MNRSKLDIKTRDYIGQLLISKEFKSSIKNLRISYLIPEEGFPISLFDEMVVDEIYPRIPEGIDINRFSKVINKILFRYGFSQEWFEFFSDYILFGFVGNTEGKKQMFLLDLGHRSEEKRKTNMLSLEKNTAQNPITLLIPPFASQRDIYDFISINWEEIERIQRKYNKELIKIVSSRKKNERVNKRNQFIYKNRLLSKKELMSKIADEFGDIMDYTYISKIIVKEEQKRSAGI